MTDRIADERGLPESYHYTGQHCPQCKHCVFVNDQRMFYCGLGVDDIVTLGEPTDRRLVDSFGTCDDFCELE